MLLKKTSARNVTRRAFTLLEVIVAAAIIGIIATVVVLGVEGSSRVGGETKRIDDAAAVLAALRDAAVRYNLGDRGDTSFTWRISLATAKGTNPGRLSQLTTKILSTDLNSCGGAFSTLNANWLRNFYPAPISSTTPFRIADGFMANDKLERFDLNGNPQANPGTTNDVTTPATLAIVMEGVALSDAQALANRVEGENTGVSPSVVRFTPSGNAPVKVYYHMAVHGC